MERGFGLATLNFIDNRFYSVNTVQRIPKAFLNP
ncbi:Uncharacterised protein [Vibrio cholerae]|nr:Uncharacterised protein [Vibrio cholerae]